MKFLSLTLVLVISGLAAPHLYAQQIYTWTDENGIIHITDQAPPKKARVEDITKYEEKPPQEEAAIETRKQQIRKDIEQRDKVEEARRAAIEAREAEKRAAEAMEKAREETQANEDYVRYLSNRRWKRKKFKKRIERIKIETEASQAQAEAAVKEAQEAATRAREAAAAAQESQQ